jgi:hypothetical protein
MVVVSNIKFHSDKVYLFIGSSKIHKFYVSNKLIKYTSYKNNKLLLVLKHH